MFRLGFILLAVNAEDSFFNSWLWQYWPQARSADHEQ
jgi:hypothetical protein